MKKNLKVAVIFICVFLAIGIFVISWNRGVFITDNSAIIGYGGRMSWNGKNYSITNGEYTEGKTIAKSPDGNWKIKKVEEDPSHTFVVARCFLDQYLLVSDDYSIPTSGKLTTVCWNGTYINDIAFLDALSKIEAEKTTSFTYETEGIFILSEKQHMRTLYFSYENCPVATEFKGYMGKVNGVWAITTDISQDRNNPDGSPKPYSVGCYVIPDEYESVLEKYFS